MPINSFLIDPIPDGSSYTSIVNKPDLISLINSDPYFTDASNVTRVDVTYTHVAGREKKTVVHMGPNLQGSASWSTLAKTGTWLKTGARIRDTDGALNFLTRDQIGTGEDLNIAMPAVPTEPIFLTTIFEVMFQSTDGSVWTQNLNYSPPQDSSSIFYNWNPYTARCSDSGAFWVLGGKSVGSLTGLDPLVYSTDGINFQYANATGLVSTVNAVETDGTIWLAGGLSNGVNSMVYSYDGINWLGLGETIFSTCYDIKWNGNMFVAGGTGGTANNWLAYSYDGLDWTGIPKTDTYSVKYLVWNGSSWVGNVGTAAVLFYSTDGINWTISAPTGLTVNNVSGMEYNGTTYVVTGTSASNPALAYSNDATNWTSLGTSVFYRCRGLAWGNGKFIATADGTSGNRQIFSSSDGVNWVGSGTLGAYSRDCVGTGNRVTTIVSIDHLNDTAYGSGLYAAIDGTNIYSSVDRTSWTNRFTSNNLSAITFGGGYFAAARADGTVLYSSDSSNWTSLPLGLQNINDIVYSAADSSFYLINTNLGTNVSVYSLTLPAGTLTLEQDIANSEQDILTTVTAGYYCLSPSTSTSALVYAFGKWDDSIDTGSMYTKSYTSWSDTYSLAFPQLPSTRLPFYPTNSTLWVYPNATPPNGPHYGFVIVGPGGFIRMLHSNQYLPNTPSCVSPTVVDLYGCVCNTAGMVVIVGDNGTIVSCDTYADPTNTFISRTTGTTQNLKSVTWDSTNFIAVGTGSKILESLDGVTWTSHDGVQI